MYRLLIADDERIECEIFQAGNGREALEIYREKKIQIAILDIEMPGINGIEAAEKIRETDRECSIIFLTAFDEFSYAKKAITVRALDYLLKPYDEQELMLVVEEAIRIAAENEAGGRLRAQAPAAAPEAGAAADSENARLARMTETVTQYIRENYMYDISMQELARNMNYSEPYFCKLFKQCFNKNFTSYLTEYRVEEAKKLLSLGTMTVKEVGKAVGYSDANYFTKVFKRITGQNPSENRLCTSQKS